MILAIYLLICGVALPIVIGFMLYKKIKERSLPKDEGNTQKNECEG